MSELKKCPFCGGEAKHWLGLDNEKGVYCTNCKAGIEVYGTLEELYNAWNTRTDGWISVKDRLPENHQEVLVYVNGFLGYFMSYARFDGNKFISIDEVYQIEEVKYWFACPEPPKVD